MPHNISLSKARAFTCFTWKFLMIKHRIKCISRLWKLCIICFNALLLSKGIDWLFLYSWQWFRESCAMGIYNLQDIYLNCILKASQSGKIYVYIASWIRKCVYNENTHFGSSTMFLFMLSVVIFGLWDFTINLNKQNSLLETLFLDVKYSFTTYAFPLL